MLIVLLSIFLTALLVFLSRGLPERWSPYLAALLLAVCFGFFVNLIPSVNEESLQESFRWVPSLGADLSLRLDGLSLVFALLITGIGTGVFVYSASYMRNYKKLAGFYSCLLVFTGSMLGLILSDNMLAFFVFWEMTSLCSFLLVGFKYEYPETQESARKALFVTVGGGLFLLVAIALVSLYGLEQGLSLNESLRFSTMDRGIIDHPTYPFIVVCIAIAVASKSAQFPLHIWLPAAMAGPTPVSSFLHSATMVKAGVYLLARLTPALGSTDLWMSIFVTMGAITMLLSAFLSVAQRDIKKILAFSTISVLGILVMLLGIGTPVAIKAAVVFLFAHALYKASLFQIIGAIDVATGNRDIYTLGNLSRSFPWLACAALLSALSMAGAPPLFGFFGKELAYLAKYQLGGVWFALMAVAVLTNILLVGLAISIAYRPFWTKGSAEKQVEIKSISQALVLIPLILAGLGLLIGVFPSLFDQYLGTPMATAIYGADLKMKLKLWHGVNLESLVVLGLSLVTLGCGFYVAVRLKGIMMIVQKVTKSLQTFGPNHFYERLVDSAPIFAKHLTKMLQNGNLSRYIQITLLAFLALLIWPLSHQVKLPIAIADHSLFSAFLALVIGIPLILAVNLSDRIKQFSLIGASGFGLVTAFVIYGAPDLALTQLMVETLSIVFLIGLIRGLSRETRKRLNSWGEILIAAFFTIMMSFMILYPVTELSQDVAQFFIDASYSQAFGRNIVNVILVDFRAMDTFGEIVVVSIAALGVGGLLAKNGLRS